MIQSGGVVLWINKYNRFSIWWDILDVRTDWKHVYGHTAH